ncbi:MAG: prepilin peptidase [Alphaproteobacteria bacterium]|nr:prepilin peptidase [Alphaproteobacteria bacterium]
MLQITLQKLLLLPCIALLLWAAISDLTSLRIPNIASLGIALLFPAQFLLHGDLKLILFSVLIGAAVFAAGAGLFAAGLLGGGDVKLLAAVALWAGPQGIFPFLLVTVIAGAACALVMMTPVGSFVQAMNGGLARQKLVMPYGVAIAVGGLFILLKPLTA